MTVEQGRRLQARIAGQGLGWGRVPSPRFYGAQKEEGGPAAPKPELPIGLCAKGGGWVEAEGRLGNFCFDIRSSSRRADTFGVPQGPDLSAQTLEDRGPC